MIQNRNQLTQLIDGGIGVELGVAAGLFSEVLLRDSNLNLLYSIDSWNSLNHRDAEYLRANQRLRIYGERSVVLRMTFDDWAACYTEPIDFVYHDGYARANPSTLIQRFRYWWDRLPVGGLLAGHDYHPKWKNTVIAADHLARHVGANLQFTKNDRYPSWWVIK